MYKKTALQNGIVFKRLQFRFEYLKKGDHS